MIARALREVATWVVLACVGLAWMIKELADAVDDR